MTTYREYQPGIAPPALQDDYGSAWLAALGDGKDTLVERIKAAVKARMPLLAPYDALASLGDERQIERLPSDTQATYARRVQDAWETWEWAGTPKGLLTALRDAGFAGGFIEIVNNRQYSLDANGNLVVTVLPNGSWAIDSTPAFWSKFQIVFPANPFSAMPPPETEIATIRALIAKWKAGFATCAGIVVITSGELWGFPQGSWSDPGVWGGSDSFFIEA